jgi:hypothetical protein
MYLVDGLRYAYRAPDGTWTHETVHSTSLRFLTFTNVSLAVDRLGGVHVSFTDASNGAVAYAYRSTSGAWSTTLVDTQTDHSHGWDSALVLDASGGVHIAYSSQTEGTLRYAYRDPSGAWSRTMIDPNPSCGRPSLGRDGSGGLHITYSDFATHMLWYAHRSPGGSWTTQRAGISGTVSSLAVDAWGGVHVATRTDGFWTIWYGYRSAEGAWSGSSWSEIAAAQNNPDQAPSIALDAMGYVYITYAGDDGLFVAHERICH